MKKLKIIPVLLVLLIAVSAPAKSLKAVFACKTFYNAESGPYVETYLSVTGSSVVYSRLDNGKFQGKIEVSLAFKLKNEIKHFDKYNLLSPEIDDTSGAKSNFIDQQRFSLPNGKYEFDITIEDKNSGVKPFSNSEYVNVEYYPNIVTVSDIELVESYKKSDIKSMLTKNNFEIIPYVNNYYPTDAGSLRFYAEVYNSQKVLGEEPFLISYFIQSHETKSLLEKFRGFTKQESKNVNMLLSEFPLSELPSGNYDLVVEVRNKKNDIIAFKEVFFQRNNSSLPENTVAASSPGNLDASNSFAARYTNRDSLAYFIKSLRPISNNNETVFEDNQVKIADVKLMQQFLFDFWSRHNPENPEKAWLEYYQQVKIAEDEFHTLNKKGFETERGRVFLQYGSPNAMQKEYRETSSYPYEIWQYYKLGTQSNRKFIFYNTDLVSNDFTLLHSDAIGENYEPQWQLKLRNRDTQTRDLDRDVNLDNFGNNANQNFTNPH